MNQTYPDWFIGFTSDVQCMRDAQQLYFKHKGNVNLQRSGEAEAIESPHPSRLKN